MSAKTESAFIVSYCIDYEGDTAIAVFSSEESAEKFVDKCREYQKLCPECPDDPDPSYWGDYERKYKMWLQNHPCGGVGEVIDGYKVFKVPHHK